MKAWVFALGLALIVGAAASAEPSPTGRWITGNGNLEVEIAPCGEALCGSVVKVLANRSMADPGKAMAAPPAQPGLKILTGLAPAGDGRWKGRIFNREDRKTYDCLIKPDGAALSVRAYLGLPALGRSQVWTRAAD